MKLKEWINLSIIILLLIIGFLRFINQKHSANRTVFLLDTHIEINATSRRKDIAQTLDKAFEIVEQYEKVFSYYDPESRLYKINNTDSLYVRITDDIYEVLLVAQRLFHESNHLYDVSIAPLLDLWDFDSETIPEHEAIESAIELIGFDRIIFDEDYISKPSGMKLNLGSLAKGYIIDKVIDFFIDNDVDEVFINAGGDIRFYSDGDRKWRIGIQHPRDRDTLISTLRIPDMAVVTSGDYERYFMVGEHRYHHIINPKTGYPATPTVSVTIFSDKALIADALSTAAFVMNPFDAIELIKSYPNTEGIIYFYDVDGLPVSLNTEKIRQWTAK